MTDEQRRLESRTGYASRSRSAMGHFRPTSAAFAGQPLPLRPKKRTSRQSPAPPMRQVQVQPHQHGYGGDRAGFSIFSQRATLSPTRAPGRGGHRGGGSAHTCVGCVGSCLDWLRLRRQQQGCERRSRWPVRAWTRTQPASRSTSPLQLAKPPL